MWRWHVADIDPFATFLKIMVYTGMILVALGGGGYMNNHARSRGEFWTLFIFVTLAMSVAVSANNLLLLFLAIEFLSITSYILAGFLRENRRSAEAGVKYFIYGSVASSLMLYGMSLLYGAAGSLDLRNIGAALAANTDLGTDHSAGGVAGVGRFRLQGEPGPVLPVGARCLRRRADADHGLSRPPRRKQWVLPSWPARLIVALGAYQVNWVPMLAGSEYLDHERGQPGRVAPNQRQADAGL